GARGGHAVLPDTAARLVRHPRRRPGQAQGPAGVRAQTGRPPQLAGPGAVRRPRMTPEVVIYTDGACSGNPGPGGWGAVLIHGKTEKEISGGEPATTNNRMELMAAIQALEALKKPCKVELHTDSQYVQKGI